MWEVSDDNLFETWGEIKELITANWINVLALARSCFAHVMIADKVCSTLF